MTVSSKMTTDRSSYSEAEPAAKVIAAEGFYGVGGWVEQPKDARDVKGLKGLRGLPIGTLLYPHPAAHAAEIEALRGCLSFFASVIKSGEPWTVVCQQQYDAAMKEKNDE